MHQSHMPSDQDVSHAEPAEPNDGTLADTRQDPAALMPTAINLPIAMLDYCQDALITLDHSWRIRFMNQAAEALLHYPRAQARGRSLWKTFPALRNSALDHYRRDAQATADPAPRRLLLPLEGGTYVVIAQRGPHTFTLMLRASPSATGAEPTTESDPTVASSPGRAEIADETVRHFGRLAFDALPIGIALLDAQDHVLLANAAFAALQRDADQYASLDVDERQPEPSQQDPAASPSRNVGHDGRTILQRTAPIVDSAGAILGTVIIAIDITELQGAAQQLQDDNAAMARASAALDERATLLQTILDTMGDGVMVFGTRGEVLMSNPTFHAIFAITDHAGFARMSLEERGTLVKLTHLDDSPMEIEHWPVSRILRGETFTGPDAIDEKVQRLDGSVVIVSVSGVPIFANPGEIVGGICVFRDVTERWQLSQMIVERAQELDAIFHSLTEGILVYDAAMQPVRWNAAYGRMIALERLPNFFALPAEERSRLTCSRSAATGRLMRLEETPIRRIMAGESMRGLPEDDLLIRSLDGHEFRASIMGAPLFDAQGIVRGAVISLRDVTLEREEQAERLQTLNIIAHELKTPLTTIKMGVQISQRYTQQGRPLTNDLFTPWLIATLRMERMLNDLLDAAKLENHRQFTLEREPCDLVSLCAQAIDDQQKASLRTIAADLPDGRVVTLGDPLRLAQIITNLLSNALKYTPADAAVRLTLHQDDQHAILIVSDAGPGIAQEVQDRIFEIFYRAPTAKVLHGSGIGLGIGLYLTRQLVELHGGTITVFSIPGQGATFTVKLPLA